LDQWLREQLPERFEGRIVPEDGQVADACSRLLARARQAGRRPGTTAALIAAACLACDLALATPDLGDFEELGVELFAP
jgi:toxin FitB